MLNVRFQSSCPACRNPGSFYWVHANCGGDLYLNNQAKLICNYCLKEDYIFRWKFDCGNSGYHRGGFEYGCLQGFYDCLSNIGKLQNPPLNYIFQVTNALFQHQNEFNIRY